MSSDKPHILRFWKVLPDGKRQPVEIHANAKLEIQKVVLDGQDLAHVDMQAIVAHRHRITIRPQGNDSKHRVAAPFFVESHPCWFEGCDELRANYAREKENLENDAKSEGRECSGCELGALMRKYSELVEKALQKQSALPDGDS